MRQRDDRQEGLLAIVKIGNPVTCLECVGDQVGMRQADAFGFVGSATGVEDGCQIAVGDADARWLPGSIHHQLIHHVTSIGFCVRGLLAEAGCFPAMQELPVYPCRNRVANVGQDNSVQRGVRPNSPRQAAKLAQGDQHLSTRFADLPNDLSSVSVGIGQHHHAPDF